MSKNILHMWPQRESKGQLMSMCGKRSKRHWKLHLCPNFSTQQRGPKCQQMPQGTELVQYSYRLKVSTGNHGLCIQVHHRNRVDMVLKLHTVYGLPSFTVEPDHCPLVVIIKKSIVKKKQQQTNSKRNSKTCRAATYHKNMKNGWPAGPLFHRMNWVLLMDCKTELSSHKNWHRTYNKRSSHCQKIEKKRETHCLLV